MTKKIYIASGLKNYNRVLELRDRFIKYGITLTYDWAEVYKKHIESEFSSGQQENLEEIAMKEYQAVLDCDLFFMLYPAGRGGHFEFGVAFTKVKPIIILHDSHYDPIAFNKLPGIHNFSSENDAINFALGVLGYEKS